MSQKHAFLLLIKNDCGKDEQADAWLEFALEAEPEDTVLDMLERLRGEGRQVPAYRHSCHHGSCGSCGAVIDGVPALMCLTRASSLAAPHAHTIGSPLIEPAMEKDGRITVRLEPLTKMEVLGGIAVHPGRLFGDIPDGLSYLVCSDAKDKAELPPEPEASSVNMRTFQTGGRQRFEACIECGLCVAVCPIKIPFIGPYVLAAINRERTKYPGHEKDMLAIADKPDGAWPCDRHLYCSMVCPQAVYPAKHIQLLKNSLLINRKS